MALPLPGSRPGHAAANDRTLHRRRPTTTNWHNENPSTPRPEAADHAVLGSGHCFSTRCFNLSCHAFQRPAICIQRTFRRLVPVHPPHGCRRHRRNRSCPSYRRARTPAQQQLACGYRRLTAMCPNGASRPGRGAAASRLAAIEASGPSRSLRMRTARRQDAGRRGGGDTGD